MLARAKLTENPFAKIRVFMSMAAKMLFKLGTKNHIVIQGNITTPRRMYIINQCSNLYFLNRGRHQPRKPAANPEINIKNIPIIKINVSPKYQIKNKK